MHSLCFHYFEISNYIETAIFKAEAIIIIITKAW
jgi:hypothetical protein